MGEENPRRSSQVFDPLSRLGELTRLSHSTPSSPRLLPRRLRDASSVLPPSLAAFEVVDASGHGSCSSNNGSVNWQERCLELQLELHRSRTQATRTRDMLRDKEYFDGQFEQDQRLYRYIHPFLTWKGDPNVNHLLGHLENTQKPFKNTCTR